MSKGSKDPVSEWPRSGIAPNALSGRKSRSVARWN